MTVLEWLVRLLDVSFDMGVRQTYGVAWCMYSALYNGKGNKYICSNSRGISLLSVVDKLYGRLLSKRVRAGTECAIMEEQCGFRLGRECIYVDHVFEVRLVCEKYLANGEGVFWALVDLEKAYDTINRHGMWQMLCVYGVGGKSTKAVRRVYVDIRACVWVGNDVSELFPFNVGLR